MNLRKVLSLKQLSSGHFLAIALLTLIPVVTALLFLGSKFIVGAHGGDTALVHGCKDARGRLTVIGESDTCNASETAVDWVKDVLAGTGLTASRGSSGVTLSVANASTDGWTAAGETWTYASADDPTFTFTISGDKTDKYSPGMRVKLTQTTTKYFLITGVAYSSPNTTVTVYGGTDYDLANASITNPYLSNAKAPQGFPSSPPKWTVEVSDSTNRSQASVVQNTWYNIGSTSIDVPIGLWNVSYVVSAVSERNDVGHMTAYITLSTGNNSESDTDMTTYILGSHVSSDSNTAFAGASVYKDKVLNLTSKTTYYLNTKTDQTGIDALYNNNAHNKLFIRAVSAYL